jgi:iron uptake system component EfeO
MQKRISFTLALLTFGGLAACAPAADEASRTESPVTVSDVAQPPSDSEFEAQVVRALHDAILTDIDTMKSALLEIQAAAPVVEGRGWDLTLDGAAIGQMRAAWERAREAYERIEGVVAPIFPFIDTPLDERYEGFLSHLGTTGGDQNLFDGRGVTGMHAIERIIYSNLIPPNVVTSESAIPGYKAAAFPATTREAADFKSLLCGRALSDTTLLRREWDGAVFDASLAFVGLVDLMMEQREKVNKASSNEEESRYSQRTMADLRHNLVGTTRSYEIFAPWIVSKAAPAEGGLSGKAIDARIRAGFAELAAGYERVSGPSIPAPPKTWSASPSAADLGTPFGKLYTLVRASVNPNSETSVVANMNAASGLLGFRE